MLSQQEIEKNFDDFLVFYYNVPCKGCKEGHPSMWKTIIESPQWEKWKRYNENTNYDWSECEELGVMSAAHFQNFIKFICSHKH